MKLLSIPFILSLTLLCCSCKDEFKGGQTFVVDKDDALIESDSVLDETVREIDSLNLGLVDSIKVGPTIKFD